MKRNIVLLLIIACLFAADVRAAFVKEAYLPDFRRGKNVFDIESSKPVDLKEEPPTDEEYYRQLQKIGDIYYDKGSSPFRGDISIISGVYEFIDASRFKTSERFSLSQHKVLSGPVLNQLGDKYIVLQTRNKQIIAMYVLGISKLRLHICWIVADSQTGLFSDQARQELIEHVKTIKTAKMKRKPVSGQTRLYDSSRFDLKGFYFGQQKVVSYSGKTLHKNDLKKITEDKLFEYAMDVVKFKRQVDITYKNVSSPIMQLSGGKPFVLYEGDMAMLPSVIRKRRAPASFLVPPELNVGSVYLVQTIDAEYALIKVTSFSKDSITFSWLYQPDGTMNFPKKEIESGRWTPPKKPQAKPVTLFDILEKPKISLEEKKDIIESAIEQGFDVNSYRDEEQKLTLLHYICGWYQFDGKSDLAKLLISLDADINFRATKGLTPLHVAAFSGQLEICKLLVENGADTTILNSKEQTPLEFAARNNLMGRNDEIIQYLGPKTPPKTLHAAAIGCNIDGMKLLLHEKHNPNEYDEKGYTPLHHAAENDCAAVCKILLDAGADPLLTTHRQPSNKSPLVLAALLGKSNVVKTMIENFSFDEEALSNALYKASASRLPGTDNNCRILLDAGGDPDYDLSRSDMTPYAVALKSGSDSIIKVYLDHGKTMPLWGAVHRGMKNEIKVMLEKGADVNGRSPENHPPLAYAIFAGHTEIAKMLIERNPELNKTIGRGKERLLYYAIMRGETDISIMLIEAGTDVNTQGGHWSPLYLAVTRGNTAVVQKLLEYGADQNILPSRIRDRSYLEMAKDGGYDKVYKLLEKYK